MTPRFTVRFSNGFWKVFDNQFYCSADIFDLKVEAEQAVARFYGKGNKSA